jgi:hypothetical protein
MQNSVRTLRPFVRIADSFKTKKQPFLTAFVIPGRFERPTHSLEGCCSIQLSYGTFFRVQKYIFFQFMQYSFHSVIVACF